MGRILRVGLMVLLAAAVGVGIAQGEGVTITVNGVEWEYEQIKNTNTCRIRVEPWARGKIEGEVYVPKEVVNLKVVEIWEYAFSESKLAKVSIPNSVKTIGFGAFWGCKELKAVNIPNGVKTIGSSAFRGCKELKAVKIPNSVTTMGEYAFQGCSNLTTVSIPNSVKTIGENAFYGCSGLTAVEIPNSVKTIGERAFQGCSKLTAVEIPNSVETIGNGAFYGCSELTAVEIPNGVKTIGENAFYGCSKMMEFKVDESNASYCAVKGVLFTKDNRTLISCPEKKEGEYRIPAGVTTVAKGAFSGCAGLTAVTIPGSVKELGERAFLGCSGLKELVIPGGVTMIGPAAFYGCSGLREITIPSSVKMIRYSAFGYCSGLNKVFWLAGADGDVDNSAFDGIATPATLYVRKGEKAKIEGNGKTWWNRFTIMEFCVVTFWDRNMGTIGKQRVVLPNGKATEPEAPTKEGYTFVEWQLDGVKYDFSKKVTQNITLEAVWNKKDDSETAVESVQLAAVRVVRNPVGEVLELEGMERTARVEVYSVVGARVHAEALRGEPRVAIDARGWGSGVYVVRVVASDGEKTLRVVK